MAEQKSKTKLIIGILATLLIICLIVIAVLVAIPKYNDYKANIASDAQKSLIEGFINEAKAKGGFSFTYNDQTLVVYDKTYLDSQIKQ